MVNFLKPILYGAVYIGPVGKCDRAFHGVNHAFGVQSRFSTTTKDLNISFRECNLAYYTDVI